METQTTVSQQKQTQMNPWPIAVAAPLLLGPIWLLGGHSVWNTDFAPWNTLLASVMLMACFAAAIDDTIRMKISNWITYPALSWAFGLSVFVSVLPEHNSKWIGFTGFGDMLLGGLVCFLIVLVPYLFGVGGGGDAKLAAAIGAGLGLQYGLIAVASTFVIAAALSIGSSIVKRGPVFVIRAVFRRLGSWLSIWVLPPSDEDQVFLSQPLPMGPSFFLGVLLTLNGVIPCVILSR